MAAGHQEPQVKGGAAWGGGVRPRGRGGLRAAWRKDLLVCSQVCDDNCRWLAGLTSTVFSHKKNNDLNVGLSKFVIFRST